MSIATSAAVFAASWAGLSAVAGHHAPPSKVFTIPLHADVSCEPSESDIEQWIERPIGRDIRNDETLVKIARRWARIWMDRDLYGTVSENADREHTSRLSRNAFAGSLEPVLTNLSMAI